MQIFGLGDLEKRKLGAIRKVELWRFGEENDALWRNIIFIKYGEDQWDWVLKTVLSYRISRKCEDIPSLGMPLM